MARSPSQTLTPAELKVMQALWRLGPSSAADVVRSLHGRRGPQDSTVRTILRILERKGYVRHQRDGRTFVYQTVVAEDQAQRGAVREVLSRFFENSPERLVLNLLRHEDVSSQELARLRKLVDDE
jgi:BlaI family transcriptional regulator, penicillinase repressor